jgi:hypothetical protein
MDHALTEPAPRGVARQLSTTLRRVLLVAPPLALAALSAVHPAPDVTATAVMDVATWFAAFHMIQLVLVGLVTLSVFLLAEDFGVATSWTVRLCLGAFLVFFSAYDAVAGIATGLAMRSARDLPPAEQEAIFQTVKDWPAFDPAVFALNVVGTLAWVVALVAIARAARRAGAGRAEWILIGLAGVALLGGHPLPFGTVAFGCLFLAAVLHVRSPERAPEPRPAVGLGS